MRGKFYGLAVLSLFAITSAWAAPNYTRWKKVDQVQGTLQASLDKIQAASGLRLTAADFVLYEDRQLATSKFQMWVQQMQGLPVMGTALRIWVDSAGMAIQGEAHLQSPDSFRFATASTRLLPTDRTQQIAENLVATAEDSKIRSAVQSDVWFEGQMARRVEMRSKHGKHIVIVSMTSGKVLSQQYLPHQDAETFSVPARAFPIYEETEYTHERLQPVEVMLTGLKSAVPNATTFPFGEFTARRYLGTKYHPLLGETELGRSYGFWSMDHLKMLATGITAALPTRANTSDISIEGNLATVSIHPSAVAMYGAQLGFTPRHSPYFRPDWRQVVVNGRNDWQMTPTQAYLGKPLANIQDAMGRTIRREAEHNTLAYIQDGFDELQVYYAVTKLMEVLQARGWADADLSTRPFHAFLYDTDIEYRDNAYYTDDTINFTTYSATSQNMARDNPTIWHELGHGVMDRMMGSMLQLADTGGLSEGMADFVAMMVIQAIQQGRSYAGQADARILNNTGFFLTNEVHDDGEAYGGAMNDMLEAAMRQYGPAEGVHKVIDVTLEAMRLTRNHPALTAQEWFSHVLYADELGRVGVRAPGELGGLISTALAGRNFLPDESLAKAQFNVRNGTALLGSSGAGSRGAPILRELAEGETAEFNLSAQVVDGAGFQFRFPVRLEVSFNGWALQGNVHWVGEEAGSRNYTFANAAELQNFTLAVSATCDGINVEDGSCKDYAMLKIFDEAHQLKPIAKKRFYVRVKRRS